VGQIFYYANYQQKYKNIGYWNEKDASCISDDGFRYDNGKKAVFVEWISVPHFFKSDNMIILYVGENSEIISVLEELVDPQFAGL